MAYVKDWMMEAAEEILRELPRDPWHISEPEVRNIIAKYCPMKPNVAYMPVPRCETCKHWKPVIGVPSEGLCRNVNAGFVILVTPDFGCVKWEAK
jgi:hypothetical protein